MEWNSPGVFIFLYILHFYEVGYHCSFDWHGVWCIDLAFLKFAVQGLTACLTRPGLYFKLLLFLNVLFTFKNVFIETLIYLYSETSHPPSIFPSLPDSQNVLLATTCTYLLAFFLSFFLFLKLYWFFSDFTSCILIPPHSLPPHLPCKFATSSKQNKI